MMMGQAAGTAAAMAVKENNGRFSEVSVIDLRSKLWDDGLKNPDELPFD